MTLEVDTAGGFTSKDVITGSQSVTTTVKLATGNTVNDNYVLRAQPSLTGTITAKPLTMTSSTAATKVYDGTTVASVTLGTLSGEVVGETLGTPTVVGTFNSKDVSAATTVTAVYTLVNGANGELASNYSLANDSLAATITRKDLDVDGGWITISKVYDGTSAITPGNVTINASALAGNSTGPNDGKYIGSENVTLALDNVGAFASRDVVTGIQNTTTTVKLATGNAVNDNYSLRPQPVLTGAITAKDVTIATGGVQTKVYDGTTLAAVTAGNLTGLVSGEQLGATTALGFFDSKDVLTATTVSTVYTLTDGANGELASNYNLLNPTENIGATIIAKDVTLAPGIAPSKVYDGNTTASVTLGTTTVVGTFNSKDVLAANTVTANYTLNDGLNGELASNYNLLNPTETISSSITAKPLTMTGSTAVGKVYDGNTTASVNLGSLSGEVSGETLGAPTVVGTFDSKDVIAASTVTAVYTLVDGANGELASNYSLADDYLAATITAKALTMTGSTATSKVYDGNTTAAVTVGTLTGEVSGETLGLTTAIGTFNSK
ncbi:MAG: hypothetical protein EBT30_08790, partial [Verrucomicrobia bacterium]|nr:hypothetical protein [Verrucomicrobiota bacterium]